MMLQETPLQLAMRAGEFEIVEYLKQQRADTDSLVSIGDHVQLTLL